MNPSVHVNKTEKAECISKVALCLLFCMDGKREGEAFTLQKKIKKHPRANPRAFGPKVSR